MTEKTLAIIKPDAFKKRIIGKIIQRIEEEGFNITQMKLVRLDQREAERFYYVHKDKSFFESLTKFMSSGPCVVLSLEGENTIARWREVMGATDPALAKSGTLRRTYGFSIERNSVHGSDSKETAAFELGFFFKGNT